MAAADAGDVKLARDLTLLATELLAAAAERERLLNEPGLQNAKQRGRVGGKMTAAQKADRALAISEARTRGQDEDSLQAKIQASEWKTHNRYARERLGISPGMLTRYKAGDYPVPRNIQDLIRLDFGIRIGKA